MQPLPFSTQIDASLEVSTIASQRKPTRPMLSGIPEFEAGYAAFVADVFARGVSNVECHEDDVCRSMTLAGAHRYVVDKVSGVLRFERLEPGSIQAPVWLGAPAPDLGSFWLSKQKAGHLLTAAWADRLSNFTRSASDLFPEPPAGSSDVADAHWEARHKYSCTLSFAAERRLGGTAKRLTAAKVVIGTLWNFLLDRDLLRLCHSYFGFRAGSTEYNMTARRQADLRARATETPNLTPLLGAFILTSTRLKSGRYRLPLDIVALAKNVLTNHPRVDYAKQWIPLFSDAMTPSGWRYMAAQSRSLNEALWSQSRNNRSYRTSSVLAHCAAMNILAQGGKTYPFSFIKWLVTNISEVRLHCAPSPESLLLSEASARRFFQLAGDFSIIAKRAGSLKRFLCGDLQLAFDWLKFEINRPNENQEAGNDNIAQTTGVRGLNKNATWASVMRAQRAWHAGRAERERVMREANAAAYDAYMKRRSSLQWSNLVDDCAIQGIHIFPLTTGQALIEEGIRMNHCVASYIEACVDGTSRIFSLQDGMAAATVELIKTGKHTWRVRQVFGPGNDIPDKCFSSVATVLAQRYGVASKST